MFIALHHKNKKSRIAAGLLINNLIYG